MENIGGSTKGLRDNPELVLSTISTLVKSSEDQKIAIDLYHTWRKPRMNGA